MGIDCPDIRRIIHWGMPSTVEEYVQETGLEEMDIRHQQSCMKVWEESMPHLWSKSMNLTHSCADAGCFLKVF